MTELNETIIDSKNIISIYNKATELEKETLRKRDISDLFCVFDGQALEYSHFKEQYTRFNYNLTQSIYKNGLSLRTAYDKAGIVGVDWNLYNEFDETIIKKIVTVSFRDLLEQYIELRKRNENLILIQRFETEYPLFKEAFDQLGESKINTCGFVESKIIEALKTVKSMDSVFCEFYKEVGPDRFISSADAKELLKKIYLKLDIKGSPTASLLKKCNFLKVDESKPRINGKSVNGFKISINTTFNLM